MIITEYVGILKYLMDNQCYHALREFIFRTLDFTRLNKFSLTNYHELHCSQT